MAANNQRPSIVRWLVALGLVPTMVTFIGTALIGYGTLNERLSRYDDSFKQLQLELSEIRGSISDLKETAGRLDERSMGLRRDLDRVLPRALEPEFNEELDRVERDLGTLNTRYESLQARFQELSSDNAATVSALKSSLSAFSSSLDVLEKYVSGVKGVPRDIFESFSNQVTDLRQRSRRMHETLAGAERKLQESER